MLTKKSEQQIYDFVKNEPRTIQEVSHLLKVSWVTASRYVEQLSTEGIIGCRTFRGGTQGALKIVYLKTSGQSISAAEQYIRTRIFAGTKKEDFSPSEIFQYAAKKEAKIIPTKHSEENFKGIRNHFLKAEEQILIFSGNLSFINYGTGKEKVFDTFKTLIQRGVSIKILCRVELAGIDNIEKLLLLNKLHGKDMITIKHAYHPLRADIIDNNVISCTETFKKSGFKETELHDDMSIIYAIRDKEWINFLTHIFWEYYRGAIPAQERISIFRKIINTGKYS